MGRIRFNEVQLSLPIDRPSLDSVVEDVINSSVEDLSDESSLLELKEIKEKVSEVKNEIDDIKLEYKQVLKEELMQDLNIAHEKIDNLQEELLLLTKDISVLEEKVSKQQAPVEVKEIVLTKFDDSALDSIDLEVDELHIKYVEILNRVEHVETMNKKLLFKVNSQNLMLKIALFGMLLLTVILSIH